MLMGGKTGISPRHSIVVTSFLGSYPAILSAPKAGLESILVGASVNFGAMQTFDEWDKGNAIHGLAITLTKSMWDKLTALNSLTGKSALAHSRFSPAARALNTHRFHFTYVGIVHKTSHSPTFTIIPTYKIIQTMTQACRSYGCKPWSPW